MVKGETIWDDHLTLGIIGTQMEFESGSAGGLLCALQIRTFPLLNTAMIDW